MYLPRSFGELSDFIKAKRLWEKYKDRTMISQSRYIQSLLLARETTKMLGPDCQHYVVECGAWKGGMAAGLIEMCFPNVKNFAFFDSFAGLPDANPEKDGAAAVKWQENATIDSNYNNCIVSQAVFQDTISRVTGKAANVEVYEGFFDATLPSFGAKNISVLRLDGDWYESTMVCLRTLYDSVVPGGMTIIDDYFDWNGCAKAVHEFLGERSGGDRIRTGVLSHVAYVRKPKRAA